MWHWTLLKAIFQMRISYQYILHGFDRRDEGRRWKVEEVWERNDKVGKYHPGGWIDGKNEENVFATETILKWFFCHETFIFLLCKTSSYPGKKSICKLINIWLRKHPMELDQIMRKVGKCHRASNHRKPAKRICLKIGLKIDLWTRNLVIRLVED